MPTLDEASAETVAAFLATHHGAPAQDLEPLGGGAWSSAWAYRVSALQFVVRFGDNLSWYDADRRAMSFARPDLPVPEVREVGVAPDGHAFAISVRHHGRFLEDTPVELAPALAPTLTRLLVALRSVPSKPGEPVVWHDPQNSPASWRDFLLDALADNPNAAVHGWSDTLAAEPRLAALAEAARRRVDELLEACPERRDLVHGDLLHGNVLISADADRVEAVFSWKCSIRGDFLYDAAWCSFWSPWHDGIAAADPVGHLLAHPTVRSDSPALVDAAERHHCYELHIGYAHLGWNVWTGNDTELANTARHLAEVLERGPSLGLSPPT